MVAVCRPIFVTAPSSASSNGGQSYNERGVSNSVKRNALVIAVVVCILFLLGLAGWANWQNRKQLALHQQALANQAVLVADNSLSADSVLHMKSPLVGKPAPAFALATPQGDKLSLASFKGKAVQINFWATWCAPCKIETPWLVELEKQYKPQGFEILAVSVDDLDKDDPKLLAKDIAGVAKGAKELHIDYPVLIDGDSIAKPYGDVDVYPTSFFINRSGKIVAASFGLTSKDDLEANIKKALGEGKS
jgi:thiol-disulfide isomerase/thioredoxin